jgi:DNA-binding GntR family transcriptional regulator
MLTVIVNRLRPDYCTAMASLAEDRPNVPRNRGTTVDRLLDGLRNGILSGRFAPGQRLIEADLTREFGVSRGPLREAFRRLSAEGLIELVPNRGALVRRLSFRETVELFQIRTELECLAARRAAENIGERCVRETFEADVAPIWSEEARLSVTAYLDENRRFHDAVIAASGNSQLAVISRQLQLPFIMSQFSNTLSAGILCESVNEHRAIAAAILSGDPALAARAMRRHLCRAARLAATMPGDVFRQRR